MIKNKPITIQQFLHLFRENVAADEKKRLEVMLEIEASLWAQGFTRIAGTDEAGRGPIAGPLVAAAVILDFPVPGLNDSKKLTETAREALYERLFAEGHAIGVALKSAGDIDRHGIQYANLSAMIESVGSLSPSPDFVLVDGYNLTGLSHPVMRVIKGDARSLNIAAASVVAKVTRDRIMRDLDVVYPGYGFAQHKGYGTREHLAALAAFGPCPEHRRSFAPLANREETSQLF